MLFLKTIEALRNLSTGGSLAKSLEPLGSLHRALRIPRCRPAEPKVKKTPGSRHPGSRVLRTSQQACPSPSLTQGSPCLRPGPPAAPWRLLGSPVSGPRWISHLGFSADGTAPRRKGPGGRGTSSLPAGASEGTADARGAADPASAHPCGSQNC